jgi:voltage-gated potassium channel
MNQPGHLARFRFAGLLLLVVVGYGTAGYQLIEHWSLLDSFFMTLITISTVGYEEVHILSPWGKIFTSTLIVGGVGTMLYSLGVFTEMVASGEFVEDRRRRRMERTLAGLKAHFIVCGYGRIGTRIVRELEQQEIPYVVIDNTPEAVERAKSEGRLYVEGDAAREEVLVLAGIGRARGLICAVDSDERAVYITLAARAVSSSLYLIARAGRPESVRRLELAGANRVISPYAMAGHRMAELALRPVLVDLMDSLHQSDGDFGVQELLVDPSCGRLGMTLKSAGLFNGSGAQILAVRRRDGRLHVNPDGDLALEEGDLLVALGSEDQLQETASALA